MSRSARGPRLFPGARATLGVTLGYLGIVVLVPLAALVARGVGMGPRAIWETVTEPRVAAAYRLSVLASLGAALLDAALGLLVAWVLVRYSFPGRRVLDALVDLPFALPTAVSGITLATLYGPNGWLGRPLAAAGFPVAFTRLGIVVALAFVGLPFVVRALEPVLAGLDREVEEAAASLGASRGAVVRRVVLPALLPAWLTGFALAFARGLGEYGSVVFIAGNMPMKTEIAPLLVVAKLEQYDEAGAAAIALVLLAASFGMLASINTLQAWAARRAA